MWPDANQPRKRLESGEFARSGLELFLSISTAAPRIHLSGCQTASSNPLHAHARQALEFCGLGRSKPGATGFANDQLSIEKLRAWASAGLNHLKQHLSCNHA